MRDIINKYLAWGVWHRTNDLRLVGDPVSQLNNRHARQDTNEQFLVQRALHTPLIHDRMYLMGFTAIQALVHFSSACTKINKYADQRRTTSALLTASTLPFWIISTD